MNTSPNRLIALSSHMIGRTDLGSEQRRGDEGKSDRSRLILVRLVPLTVLVAWSFYPRASVAVLWQLLVRTYSRVQVHKKNKGVGGTSQTWDLVKTASNSTRHAEHRRNCPSTANCSRDYCKLTLSRIGAVLPFPPQKLQTYPTIRGCVRP